MKYEALGEEVNLLKTATGGDNAASGAAAYDVAETLGGTFKVQDGAIVYAYQLGIADLDVTESGISVTVRLEEGDAAVTRELAGRKVRVVSGEEVLAEADAFFEEGEVTLTFTNTADVLEFVFLSSTHGPREDIVPRGFYLEAWRFGGLDAWRSP